MSSNAGVPEPPPLESILRHRRESFWQIIFPVVLVALIFIGLVVAMVLLTRPESPKAISIVADYASIVVIMPGCALGFLLAGLVGGLAFGIGWVQKKIPPYSAKAQHGANVAYRTTVKVTDTISSVSLGILAVLGGFANTLEKCGLMPKDEPESDQSRIDREEK